MKKIKWFFGILLTLIVIGTIAIFAYIKVNNQEIPESTKGPAADALAQSMLTTLNKPAWDKLRYVQWTFFRGKHHYQWDKQLNRAIVKWDDNKVLLNLNEVDGKAYIAGAEQTGDEKKELVDEAWGYWCNDSFWLYAPYKVMDPGVVRSVVTEEDRKGLMVAYESGGVTPGDTYLWWLDEYNKPTSWQMWTSILPLKGIENSWEDWKTLPGGSMVSTSHDGLPMKAKLSNVNAGNSPTDIGLESAADFEF